MIVSHSTHAYSTLLTRWNVSVLKVGVPCGCQYTDACKEAAREAAYESNPEKKKEAARKAYNVNSKYK